MECRICGAIVPHLVKSHILPAALMRDMSAPGTTMVLGGTDTNHLQRLPTVVYERIACATCEQLFGPGDEYLVKVIRDLPHQPSAGNGVATALKGVKPEKLERAILAVLYRAHLSTNLMFKAVDLGPLAKPLAAYVIGTSPKPMQFSLCLRHVATDIGQATFDPFMERWGATRAIRFYLPTLTAFIRVDRRPFPPVWQSFELHAGREIFALRNLSFTPSEMEVAASIVVRHDDQYSKLYKLPPS